MKNELPRIPCHNQDFCKYAPNCHTSVHHLYPRRLGKTALQFKFIQHPKNKFRVCRDIHDMLDHYVPDELPPRDYIKEFLDEHK